jgi:hypothetical protein
MGRENLVFKVSQEVVYDPLGVTAGISKTITITNMGTESLVDLGLYIKPATGLGELDYPSDYPPDTDYQDLLTWGENSNQGVAISGGIYITVTQNSGIFQGYVTRIAGSTLANKIAIKDLAAAEELEIVIDLETPPSGSPRRLYIDLVVD